MTRKLARGTRFRDVSLAVKGLLALCVPLAALILAFSLVLWVESRSQTAARWVDHTHEAEKRILEVSLASVDAEAGVRGFALTGWSPSLSSFFQGRAAMQADLDLLERTVRDNPVQLRYMARFRSVIEKRFAILMTVLDAARRRERLDPELLAKSRSVGEELRNVSRAMIAEEERLLAIRTAARNRAYRSEIAVAMAALALGLLGSAIAHRVLVAGIVTRVEAVREHAVRLAERTDLESTDTSDDEIGQLDRSLLKTAQLLTEREATLRRIAGELESANQHLVLQTEEAEHANRQKSEFLANMSHELRTPLNAILGFGELLFDGKRGALTESQLDLMGEIVTSGRHLLAVINSILDLAKVESGNMEFFPARTDLHQTLAEVAGVLREVAARKRIRVETSIDPLARFVVTDPGKLKQVLYNYLSNAIKFTPPEGRVQLRSVHAADGSFRVEVEDNGPGIAADQVGRLFTPFSQLGDTPREGGTGLGLALTKRIVEAQGGTVGMRAAGTRGSLFFAALPSLAEPAVPPEELAPQPLVSRSGRPLVLVVDDDAVDRGWLDETLRAAGYATETAASAAEALDKGSACRFDAVLLDLLLGDGIGWQVVTALRQGGPNRKTPILVVSVVRERDAAAISEIEDYLVKPVEPGDLLAALSRQGVPPVFGQSVLVVDDDPSVLTIMDTALRESGYDPVLRDDIASALAAVVESPPAAVILDLQLPGGDGFEFLLRFREMATGRRTPVLVFTNRDLTADDRGRLRGAVERLVHKSEGGTPALMAELASLVQLPIS